MRTRLRDRRIILGFALANSLRLSIILRMSIMTTTTPRTSTETKNRTFAATVIRIARAIATSGRDGSNDLNDAARIDRVWLAFVLGTTDEQRTGMNVMRSLSDFKARLWELSAVGELHLVSEDLVPDHLRKEFEAAAVRSPRRSAYGCESVYHWVAV